MKFLVCTDGSENSRRVLEKAAELYECCPESEISVIHVYEEGLDFASLNMEQGFTTGMSYDTFRMVQEIHEKYAEKILNEAVNFFDEKDIRVDRIFEKGNAASMIAQTSEEKDFDIIIIGSRGFGGFRKLLLGSVSNAVVHELKKGCILVVK